MILADHDFQTGPGGSLCRACGRKLLVMLTATADDIGRHGIACYSGLSESEYHGIEAARDRIWIAVQDAASAAAF